MYVVANTQQKQNTHIYICVYLYVYTVYIYVIYIYMCVYICLHYLHIEREGEKSFVTILVRVFFLSVCEELYIHVCGHVLHMYI